ncbi:MAG: 16S rRNA (guanine(966)-N(2))-methyltransferase RsmD [Planctomycetaceae bacterium]|nr:16S rRNA (guanine(966)-N(2))-methyltransferase RsmD [Planctomycetaceae bacterium]
MRIIAGKYRRRKLLSNTGLTTRPLTDRVKEPLFERLTSRLEDARVADVFSGTGTLGLEALSRGARSTVFIEQDSKAVELLKRNVNAIGCADDCLCWRTDVMRSSFRPKNVPDFVPFDLIFFDPPYRMIEGLLAGSPLYRSLERLARSTVSANNAMLCLRTPEHSQFELPPVWVKERGMTMSNMDIHLCRLERDDADYESECRDETHQQSEEPVDNDA